MPVTCEFASGFSPSSKAPFVPVLAKTFSLQAHDIATVLVPWSTFQIRSRELKFFRKILRIKNCQENPGCEVERGDTPETIYRISLALKATFSLAQALNTPILGYLSDRFGRRPVAGLERTFHSACFFFLIILALEIKTDTPHVMQEFWAQVLLVALAAESLVFWMQGYGGFWLNWRSTLRPQSMNSQSFGERVSLRETQSCLGWAGASHRITSCPRLQAYLMNFDDKVQHNSSWSNCTTFSNLNRILNIL